FSSMNLKNSSRTDHPSHERPHDRVARLWSHSPPVLAQSRGWNPALNAAAEVQAWPEFQLSYLKDNATRARYARTLPSSTFMSNFTISAMRRSRSVPAAVSTAFF